MAEVLAEVLDLSQGQTSGRAHHDGEAPLGKGRNTHRLYRTPIDRAHEDDETRLGIAENPHRPPVIPVTGHVVDSDPEEGNGPDDSDEEHGLNYRYRFLEDAQCAGPEERGEETKEAWMTNKSESIRMQNRIAQQSFRERRMEFFHDFENFQASSGAPQSQSQSSTEDPPKSQSEEEPSPESKEVRPSSQEQKGHAKSVKECTIPDVGSAGQGADDEHTIDHSTDEENEGEVSVRQILKISPEAFSLDTPFESDVEDVSGADLWPSLFDSVDWPPLSTSALFSDEEKYSSNIGDPSQFDIFFKDSSPEQILEFTGYSFTADATARDSGGASPSHVAEDSGESPKRARNTIAARKSRAKRRESIERPEMDSEAFLEQQPRIELGVSQERHEKAEEPENSTEAAMTKVSKTNASLGQKSPTFVPRASLVLDQQANPQESKYEVIRNALYTLSRNIYHWILDGVSRWLLQSFHCSQSTLINVRDFMRGCRRISWTCDCGMRAHWDLSSRVSAAKAAALVTSLNRPHNVPSSAIDSNGQEPSPSPSASSSSRSHNSALDESHTSTPPSSASENEDGDVFVNIAQGQRAQSTRRSLMPRFIELCINKGRNQKIVAEIDLTEMKTDAEVFIAIAEKYRQSRKGRGYVAVELPRFLERYMKIPLLECCFMRPSDIIFRKFILYQHQCPEIAICDPGLPPECEVSRRRYDYKPCPMELDEIMPAHHFFHILDNPVPHTSDTWMQRLPKKLHDSLLSSRGQPAPVSWGIHINETPNWYLIFMTIFLTLLASGIFSITWAAVTKDVQGAFGMGAYVVAVLTAGMTALFFKCSEDR